MSESTRPASQRRAFTLVELLVVIGIISLLISILLPTLNKARQSGSSIYCQANEHQMSMLISEYVSENKGYLPWGYVTTPYGGGSKHYYDEDASEWAWCDTLSLMTSRKSMDNPGGYLSWAGTWVDNMAFDFNKVFHDKDVNSTAYAVRAGDYNCNPRLMPYNSGEDFFAVANGATAANAFFAQRNIGSVKQSGATMLVWDAGVQLTGDGQDHGSPLVGTQIDGGQLNGTWGTALSNPPAATYASGNLGNPIGLGSTGTYSSAYNPTPSNYKQLLISQNVDYTNPYYDNAADMRFRHMGNHNANILFVDGHVESRLLGSVYGHEICSNPVPAVSTPK